MLLTIDSGNTNIVFAVMSSNNVVGKWRIETNDRRTADEYFVWLSQLAAAKNIKLQQISGVIIANVRPASGFALERLASEHLGCQPLVVGKNCTAGVDVKLTRPSQVGADRLVNALAGKTKFGSPAILIDTGTATTFDILDSEGAYVGGVIAPGVHVSAQALSDAAAQLPLVALDQPTSPIGTDTRSAMQSGLFWGYVAMLDGMIARLKTTMIKDGHSSDLGSITVIGTGGLMKILAPAVAGINEVCLDLTLIGLSIIFKESVES
ncbi:MAG: type III pantothenate kinase [Alphaproteobacteria bacterium]